MFRNMLGLARGVGTNALGAAATNAAGHMNAQSTASGFRASGEDANYLNAVKAEVAMSKALTNYQASTASEIARGAGNP